MRYAVSRSFDASDYTIQRRQVVIGIIVSGGSSQHHQHKPIGGSLSLSLSLLLIVISYNLMRILRSVVDRSLVAAVAVGDR